MSSHHRRLKCMTQLTRALNWVTSAVQVRRDNPRLTTRREGGHAPVRMVMSRTLDLPQVGYPLSIIYSSQCVDQAKQNPTVSSTACLQSPYL